MAGAFQVGAYQPAYQQVASTTPGVGSPSGGGGGTGLGWDRHRLDKKVKRLLDDVVAEVMYRDLIKTPKAKEAAAVVQPHAETKKVAIPRPEVINWAAVEDDVAKVRQLMTMWAEMKRRREIEKADEEWFMMGD